MYAHRGLSFQPARPATTNFKDMKRKRNNTSRPTAINTTNGTLCLLEEPAAATASGEDGDGDGAPACVAYALA